MLMDELLYFIDIIYLFYLLRLRFLAFTVKIEDRQFQ